MNLDLPSSSSKRQKCTNPKKIIQTQKIKHKNTKIKPKKIINEYYTNKINPFMYTYINQIIQNKINSYIPTQTQLNHTNTKQN